MRKREGEVWRSTCVWQHVVLITRSERVSKNAYCHYFIHLSSLAPEMIGRASSWAESKGHSWDHSHGALERVS